MNVYTQGANLAEVELTPEADIKPILKSAGLEGFKVTSIEWNGKTIMIRTRRSSE